MTGHNNLATIHPHRPGMVTLSGGHSISESEARAAGLRILTEAQAEAEQGTAARKAALSNVATHIPGLPGRVKLPGKGSMSEDEARARGLRVMTEAEADAAAVQAVKEARVDAFTRLPEAAGKTRAAMRLAANNPDMTPEQARGFLRGASTDAAITAQRHVPQAQATATAPTEAERREARKAELAGAMRAHQGRR